ncbi:MAG TPA: ABC transporter ATP-binding protein [Actinomycetes bacterium]|nr:ABC transporter ATP-binding protein [Actinomycetes bacterium]
MGLRGVSVVLDGRPVLRDLTMTIPSGARLGLIGPNGAGKTTLLRTVAGLVRHQGEVRVGDAPPGALSRRELARRIALVPQHPVVPAGLTVTDYVLMGRTPYIPYFATESRRDLGIVASVLDHLDLTAFAARRIDSLSGGERQRAVLARALAQQAPVLLLDEPTTGLDVGHQQQLLELVDALRDDLDLTVVSAMHDLTVAGQFADQLVLLDGGRVAASGPTRTVLTERVISQHYHASVRVLEEPGGGIVVIPVRAARRDGAPAGRQVAT